jgi:outer membrane protein assembly factor BamB
VPPHRRRRLALAGLAAAALLAGAWLLRGAGPGVVRPRPDVDGPAHPAEDGRYAYDVPLDPSSPWPKFRADARQSGRSRVRPAPSRRRPWVFPTGKGVFSPPVVDGDGTVYVGSADHAFYALRADGSLAWKLATGGVIDSAALLDDRGRVYVPSGDGHVYALDRASGRELWRFRAHTPAQVEALRGARVYNVDWWEGHVAILPDGTLLAGNDNTLAYRIDRETGADRGHLAVNELVWSLPAVNARTGRVFLGTMFVALRNVFAFDASTGRRLWATGGLGSTAASPLLTSSHPDGAVVTAGFDGYVRAFSQASGRQLWRFATRDHVYASPAQLSDGRLIAASTDGTLYALEPEDGTLAWAFDTLAPIRSSPAVDGEDRVYVGTGDGRLLVLERDGRLRFAYRCVEGERDDVNGSPALGPEGVYVGAEDGSICFVPYDHCLSAEARADRRCAAGAGEQLPESGARLYFTSRFGGLAEAPPASLDANEPLAFTLSVRERGDTVPARIDADRLEVELSAGRATAGLAADGRTVTIVPEAPWAGPEGGRLRGALRGAYRTDPWRLGLKAFGGTLAGRFEERFDVAVRPRAAAAFPYAVPRRPGDPGAAFELGRLAAPLPTMLPSWNQIGFDSLRYLGGLVEGGGDRAVLWMIGGRQDASGRTVVDPSNATRFALELRWDAGLVTLQNDAGFELDFNGSWAMPYRRYRIAARAAPDGRIERSPALSAVVDCDRIARYGRFLKLMGLSDWRTGLMHIVGGADLSLWSGGPWRSPEGAGRVAFELGPREAVARVEGGALRAAERAVGLLLVDAATGAPVSLSYAFATAVETDAAGAVTAVRVRYEPGTLRGPVRAYYMVDGYPAARAELSADAPQAGAAARGGLEGVPARRAHQTPGTSR